MAIALPNCLVEAQDVGSKAGQLWKDAQASFGKGDYPQAANSLEAIIKGSAVATNWLDNVTFPPAEPKQQWLEPVFFMLGAAQFNAKDWPKAITVFTNYQQLFPKSPRINQVRFSLAQAQVLGGHPGDSIPILTSLLDIQEDHQKVLLLLVEAYKRANKPEQAIALMEKEKAGPNLDLDFLGKINVRLLPLYLAAGNEAKALDVLQQMDTSIEHVPDVTAFNALAVKLGDSLLAKNDITGALACYRKVRDNNQIVALQTLQIKSLQQKRAANLVLIQSDPLHSDELQGDNKDIDDQIAKDQQALAAYQTLAPVLPPLFLRIGRAYFMVGQLWEAAVVYREIMRRYPQSPEAEPALYGSIAVFDQLKQVDRAQALCQLYLTQYPTGKYADGVSFLRGILAYDAQDFEKAIVYFEDSLKSQPNNSHREQIELSLGDIKLREQKFDDAIASYQRYEKDFPNGLQVEKAEYRTALAQLFGGKTDEADAAFHAYLQKYPAGTYAADAEYRLAVIKFGTKAYDEVLADCANWQKKYGNQAQLAEVLSLEGDCYASEDKKDEAVDAYIRSYKASLTPEVLNYAIMAAAKILQKEAKWEEIVAMFQEFVKNNPNHPSVVSAISWIGRAEIKLGKIDEAEQYMGDVAKEYLNDPSREAVDDIITQLAQIYAHRHLALAPQPTNGSAASAPVFPSDPAADLAARLTIPDLETKPTARARILFAQAELARLQRKSEVEAQILLQIAKAYKPEDLSPILLGQVGDVLVQVGQPDQALFFYNQLLDNYEGSPVIDYAYNGIAQFAYDQKDYTKAEHYYFKALDKGLATAKLKDITLGEAQTLLALNRPDEAKTLFEQVASNRAWRGEATALSVFSLGEIQMMEGKFAEANAFYQRVFVAYQKYPAIQAKAYLKSGEAFEKLGRLPEAINTYTEMLNNPNLASFPETSDAKQRLQRLAQK